jgi:hypothetical protein
MAIARERYMEKQMHDIWRISALLDDSRVPMVIGS